MASGRPDFTEEVHVTNAIDASGATLTVEFPSAQSVVFDTAQNVNIASSATLTVNFDGTQTVQFSAAQDVNATIVGTPDVNITNANIEITAGTLDVDIQNASIDVFTTSATMEQHKVSVTDASTTQSWTNAIKSFIFYNDGSSDAHINFGGAATTNHFKIRAKSSFSIDFASQDSRFICAAGKTATIYAIGLY